jgi:hypothetical protein
MAKATSTLSWCNVRLGDDHNWWVNETSDPVRWDVDGLSIIDPRQVTHLIELVEPLRDYGFDQEMFDAAFIPFRIEKDLGSGKVRLKRVKESIVESDDKLFALADTLDEENGPYADLLDHLTRCRVKMLNDLFKFESKLCSSSWIHLLIRCSWYLQPGNICSIITGMFGYRKCNSTHILCAWLSCD